MKFLDQVRAWLQQTMLLMLLMLLMAMKLLE